MFEMTEEWIEYEKQVREYALTHTIKECAKYFDRNYSTMSKYVSDKKIIHKYEYDFRTKTNCRLYNIWCGIKQRCYLKSHISYKNYGAKGIIMCNEWKNDFVKFKDWSLQNGYKKSMTIDRIDVRGNYEPSNCRWVSYEEQANNKSSNLIITYKEKTKTLSEWSKELDIPYQTLYDRIYKFNYPLDKAFKKSNFQKRFITYKGKTRSLTDWCKELELNYNRTFIRLTKLKWTVEKAFENKEKYSVCRSGK